MLPFARGGPAGRPDAERAHTGRAWPMEHRAPNRDRHGAEGAGPRRAGHDPRGAQGGHGRLLVLWLLRRRLTLHPDEYFWRRLGWSAEWRRRVRIDVRVSGRCPQYAG